MSPGLVEKIASFDRGWLLDHNIGILGYVHVEKIASFDRGWLPIHGNKIIVLVPAWRK